MLTLTEIYDPRDELDKANRDELFDFARASGIKEIDEKMFMSANAAIMMRKILRRMGIVNIKLPRRQLGMPYGVIPPEPSGETMTAGETLTVEEMAERDYAAQRSSEPVPKPVTPVEKMSIGELRSECKTRGIPMARTDNMQKLREKLIGQAAP